MPPGPDLIGGIDADGGNTCELFCPEFGMNIGGCWFCSDPEDGTGYGRLLF